MIKSIFVRIIMVIAIVVGADTAIAQSSSIQLELMGQASIPHNQIFNDTPIGGLSGLSYDAKSDTYFVISDDRSDLAAARFYSFHLELNGDNRLESEGIQFENVHFLYTQGGAFYPEGEVVSRRYRIYLRQHALHLVGGRTR